MGLKGGNNANIHLVPKQTYQVLTQRQGSTLQCVDPQDVKSSDPVQHDGWKYVRNYNCVLRGERLDATKVRQGGIALMRTQIEGFHFNEAAQLSCQPTGGLNFQCSLWKK